MTPGPRLYNLFPLLCGSVRQWEEHLPRIAAMGFDWIYLNPFHYPGFSGSLYAVKDYYRINDLLWDGQNSLEDLLGSFCNKARELGLSVIMDLVINHTAKDSLLAAEHPEWFLHEADGSLRSPRAIDPADTRQVTVWGDLAEINSHDPALHAPLAAYFGDMMVHFVACGIRGFRCDAAYLVPPELWSRLIARARAERADAVFFAETLGCQLEQVGALRSAGFDYLFNSARWWDFKSPWLLEQYNAFRTIAPSIAFPESHDTARLATELSAAGCHRDDAVLVERAYRLHYLFSAVFSTGVMIPVGFEYGFRGPLNVVTTRPQHWEQPLIDISAFNSGDYARAAEFKNRFENISWVLYPNDTTPAGRELRLRQEYFFVSASLQDIIFHHLEEYGTLHNLADQVAIHLNDTHPAISVAELMRLLCDDHGMLWADAWAQCTRIFSYTNHTLMPEALETWPVGLMNYLLPRHMRIIYRINQEFLKEVAARFPDDIDLIRRLSLIDDGDGNEENKRVRMAHLSIVGSHRVNGVSQLHSDLMVKTIFADFAKLYPDRFHNKTNGVTPRRWIAQANPGLSRLLDTRLGGDWRLNLDHLAELRPLADDQDFRAEFAAAKRANKLRLADYIRRETDIVLNPDSLFDVQVKRIHEYKRQLLNVLHVITRYNAILHGLADNAAPRCVIFAGKAASSYHMAKQVIRLIHDVASVINNDPRAHDKLKVVFVPNYGVSIAELIMPAADLSEQISTAGTEASGTGNMKFSMNGALTIGTEDGANIEIRDNVGAENIFIFGNTTPQVEAIRKSGYDPKSIYLNNPMLNEALNKIDGGFFCPSDKKRYHDLFNNLVNYGDHYLLLADYASYIETQARVDSLFLNPSEWQRKAILNVAGMGSFSSDRTIRDYANDTWNMGSLLKKA